MTDGNVCDCSWAVARQAGREEERARIAKLVRGVARAYEAEASMPDWPETNTLRAIGGAFVALADDLDAKEGAHD